MADEREGAGLSSGQPANRQTIQDQGREDNAARPLNASKDHGGADRYPDAPQAAAATASGRPEQAPGEPRAFDASADNPTPRQGAGDGGAPPVSPQQGRLGPGGDPVEGKR